MFGSNLFVRLRDFKISLGSSVSWHVELRWHWHIRKKRVLFLFFLISQVSGVLLKTCSPDKTANCATRSAETAQRSCPSRWGPWDVHQDLNSSTSSNNKELSVTSFLIFFLSEKETLKWSTDSWKCWGIFLQTGHVAKVITTWHNYTWLIYISTEPFIYISSNYCNWFLHTCKKKYRKNDIG